MLTHDEKGRVALLVPTYRNTPQILVLANLTYLTALSSQNIRVFISDSSGDATKRDHLVRLQHAYPFCDLRIRLERTPLYQDVVALLKLARSYPYVALCADDDYMSLDYLLRSVDVLERDRAAVCSAGNYLVWLSNGTIQLAARESTETSPVVPLQKFDPNSFNTMFFCGVSTQCYEPVAQFL
jgi:hypothetical protein